MSDLLKVTWKGAGELEKALLDLGTELATKTLRQACRKAALVIAEDAKNRAPVGTEVRPAPEGKKKWRERKPGMLRDSIRVRARTNIRKAVAQFVVRAGGKAYYAKWVEMGTKHASAKPYLRPAVDSKADEVIATFERELAAGIQRAAKRKAKGKKK